MQINLSQAQTIMTFINNAHEAFTTDNYITCDYLSHQLDKGNVDETLRFMTKQFAHKPEVYERALNYHKTNLMGNAKKLKMAKSKYEKFEEFYQKSQEHNFDFK